MGNPSPILPPALEKSAASFVKLRFQKKHGKDMCRFGGKTCAVFGKTGSVFGRDRLRFWAKQAPSLGQSDSVLVKKWLGLGRIGWFFGLVWDKAQVSLF